MNAFRLQSFQMYSNFKYGTDTEIVCSKIVQITDWQWHLKNI